MEKNIAFMFDLAGTIEDINESTALKLFANIEKLKVKFQADKVYITLSTHYEDTSTIKYICGILKPFLNDHIVFGPHYNLNGIYNYDDDKFEYIDKEFNKDKMGIFYNHYINEMEGNQFIACFDDSFNSSRYLEYQDKHPLLCGIPNSIFQYKKHGNNMMCMVSKNYGTEGIIEILNNYLNIIKDINHQDILKAQAHMPMNYSFDEIKELIVYKKYDLLINFLNNGHPTEENCQNLLLLLTKKCEKSSINNDEKDFLIRIISLLIDYFDNINDQKTIESIKNIKLSLNII